MQQRVVEIEKLMSAFLDDGQMERLHDVLLACLCGQGRSSDAGMPNGEYVERFLSAKKLEGCSKRSISYYQSTLCRFVASIEKPISRIETSDVREYLSSYSKTSGACNVTIDNIRRVLSTFFSWLEEEDFIYKSPVRRIKKIRSVKSLKPVYSDEMLEALRDSCTTPRDLAIIDILASTGMRVGELVKLERDDIDFKARECVVHGKGGKDRRVYFDARTKLHLEAYLSERSDTNTAAFVSLASPHERLEISGVETRLKQIGKTAKVPKVHPHKFRRTLATQAIDKGMPIEQVQVLLGHSKIETTLCYAMVDQENVKRSHRKYIG